MIIVLMADIRMTKTQEVLIEGEEWPGAYVSTDDVYALRQYLESYMSNLYASSYEYKKVEKLVNTISGALVSTTFLNRTTTPSVMILKKEQEDE